MARKYLQDAQAAVPYLTNRWLLGETAGNTYVTDDIGGLVLPLLGSPTLGQSSLVRGDPSTSAMGGYTSQLNGFQAAVSSFPFGNGMTIEGVTCAELTNVTSFYLFNAPGQARLTVAGSTVSFSAWTTSQVTLTASAALSGAPQLVQGVVDPVSATQSIYVDGVSVASQALSAAIAGSTTGSTQLLVAAAATATIALGQDIAVYNGPLSANRIMEHFAAFMQQWSDPAHAQAYPYITVQV